MTSLNPSDESSDLMLPGDYIVNYIFACRNFARCRESITIQVYTMTGAIIAVRSQGWRRFDPEGWHCPVCSSLVRSDVVSFGS